MALIETSWSTLPQRNQPHAAHARRTLCLRSGPNTKGAAGLHPRQAAILGRKSPETARSPAPRPAQCGQPDLPLPAAASAFSTGADASGVGRHPRAKRSKSLSPSAASNRTIRRAIVARSTRNDRAGPDRPPCRISARNGFRSSEFIARAHREIFNG